MICITSLRNEFDTYIRNWFLYHFEGTYCYIEEKDLSIIGWSKYNTNTPNGSHNTFIVEFNNYFREYHNLTPQTIELLQYIIKKPHAKH